MPQQGEIKRCLDIIGWGKVALESDAVFLKQPDMELDFGGVVKEYAADAIAFQARQKGIHNGYINLGGDIKIIGPQRDGAPWSIGVSNPSRPEEPSAIILQCAASPTANRPDDRKSKPPAHRRPLAP